MAVLRARAAPPAPRWPFVAVGPLADRLAACIVPVGGTLVQDAGPRGVMRPSFFGGNAAASLDSGGHPLIASGSGSSTGIWGTYDGLGLSSWAGITLAVALDATRFPASSTFVNNPSLGLGGQTSTPKFGFDRSNSASYRYNVFSHAYALGYTTYSAPSEPAWELLILSEISATSRQAWRNGTSILTNSTDNSASYLTRTNWAIGPSAVNWSSAPGTTTNRHEVHYMAWWDRVLTETERGLLQRPETRWAWFEEYGRKTYSIPASSGSQTIAAALDALSLAENAATPRLTVVAAPDALSAGDHAASLRLTASASADALSLTESATALRLTVRAGTDALTIAEPAAIIALGAVVVLQASADPLVITGGGVALRLTARALADALVLVENQATVSTVESDAVVGASLDYHVLGQHLHWTAPGTPAHYTMNPARCHYDA